MKTLIGLLATLLPLFAAPLCNLSISPSGDILLNPPEPSELYASDSPRGPNWEFVSELPAKVDTNRTRFYRAYVKGAPLKLIRIVDTNQTIRGSVDKMFTNALLIVNGVTNKGWSFGGQSRRDGIRSDFTFSQIMVSNTTPATLMLWDDDGYLLRTNVLIGPGPFVPLLPKWYAPSAPQGISPASIPDIQGQLLWALTSHWFNQTVSTLEYYDDCDKSSTTVSGSWGGEAAWHSLRKTWCLNKKAHTCSASYSGTGPAPMLLEESDTDHGLCYFPNSRHYLAVTEIGSYNSAASDTITATSFTHGCGSTAELWIGGHLRGRATNYWAIISIGLEAPIERLGGDEFFWGDTPNKANSIGGAPTRSQVIIMQVPMGGLLINCTPGFGKLSQGWYRYWVGVTLVDD